MALTVNLSEMADLAGVSQATIRRWVDKDGCPCLSKGGNGVAYEFDPDQVKAWRAEKDRVAGEAEAERQRQIVDKQAEMFDGPQMAPVGFDLTRHREAIAVEREAINLSRLKGGLVPVEEVRRSADAMLGIMRQRLLAFVPNLTRSAGLTPEQQQEGDKQVRALLEDMRLAIREWTPVSSTSPDSASAASPAPEPNGSPPATC